MDAFKNKLKVPFPECYNDSEAFFAHIRRRGQGVGMKRILIVATGGTIASLKNEGGLKPELDVDDLIRLSGIRSDECIVEGVLVMNIDSTNMTPGRWFEIAEAIYKRYDDYDGFVVTHGTDTMAYTSAALKYIFKHLNKPIIVTGSQYPITEEYTDAIQNFTDAVRFAMEELAGVFIVFDGNLIAGTRAIKVKTRSYDAFESVNFPNVATIKHHKISYNPLVSDQFRRRKDRAACRMRTKYNDRILVLKLIPGMYPDIFDYIRENYKGVIIESFGIGGIPNDDRNLSRKIVELVEAGIAVVLTTQCLEEGVEFGIYEVGNQIPTDKVIYAGDFNTEALVAKTMIGMGSYDTIEALKAYIETPSTYKHE